MVAMCFPLGYKMGGRAGSTADRALNTPHHQRELVTQEHHIFDGAAVNRSQRTCRARMQCETQHRQIVNSESLGERGIGGDDRGSSEAIAAGKRSKAYKARHPDVTETAAA